MKIAVLVLALLISTEGALASRWAQDAIPVLDGSGAKWRDDIQRSVDDYNANLPKSAPRLVYTPVDERACASLPERGTGGSITFCSEDLAPGILGYTWPGSGRKPGILVSARIALTTDPATDEWQARTPCHELMHALVAAPHDPGAHPTESCIQGDLTHLGAWDIAYLESAYAQTSGHKSKHKRKHR